MRCGALVGAVRAPNVCGNEKPRFERIGAMGDACWYRIPDSQRIVSCVSAAFTQCYEEKHGSHETGSMRVQIRDHGPPALSVVPNLSGQWDDDDAGCVMVSIHISDRCHASRGIGYPV
jgi:hypothetical protein